jgi:hypothetical protein
MSKSSRQPSSNRRLGRVLALALTACAGVGGCMGRGEMQSASVRAPWGGRSRAQLPAARAPGEPVTGDEQEPQELRIDEEDSRVQAWGTDLEPFGSVARAVADANIQTIRSVTCLD